MTLRYREWEPVPAAAGLIEAIWSLSDRELQPASEPQRVLPDGCSELILNFDDPVSQVLEDGSLFRQPRLLFVGQIPGPFYFTPSGRLELIGIRFRPAGAAGLIREPQSRLVGLSHSLQELTPSLARELAGAAFDAPDPESRVRLIQAALVAHARPRFSPIPMVADRLIRRGGNGSVDELVSQTGLGARQFERRFLAEVGLRPKLFARICRFQQVFRVLEQQPAHWARVAADCGYYDSSHLIRDFRELSGETPVRLVQESHQLTRLFTRARRMS